MVMVWSVGLYTCTSPPYMVLAALGGNPMLILVSLARYHAVGVLNSREIRSTTETSTQFVPITTSDVCGMTAGFVQSTSPTKTRYLQVIAQ